MSLLAFYTFVSLVDLKFDSGLDYESASYYNEEGDQEGGGNRTVRYEMAMGIR